MCGRSCVSADRRIEFFGLYIPCGACDSHMPATRMREDCAFCCTALTHVYLVCACDSAILLAVWRRPPRESGFGHGASPRAEIPLRAGERCRQNDARLPFATPSVRCDACIFKFKYERMCPVRRTSYRTAAARPIRYPCGSSALRPRGLPACIPACNAFAYTSPPWPIIPPAHPRRPQAARRQRSSTSSRRPPSG